MSTKTIKIAVAGLGFMGRTHIQAYQAAMSAGLPCVLSAVCDPNPERLTGKVESAGNIGSAAPTQLFDPAAVRGYLKFEDLLASDVDVISICTYTESHVDLAIAAHRAGKHVLVEKPVALTSKRIDDLCNAIGDGPPWVIPAMCIRFWPGWDWLKKQIAASSGGPFGKVRTAAFQRLGSGPTWGGGFYSDLARSGGAVIDLHIHDTDFIYWCFGPPRAVCSTGDALHISTQYRYDHPDGPVAVIAEGAWDLAPTAGFRMKFLATFEHATVEFDLSRSPSLMVHTQGESKPVQLPELTGYDGEIRAMINLAAGGPVETMPCMREAHEVARLLERELESMKRCGQVEFEAS